MELPAVLPFTGLGTVCQGRAFISAELRPRRTGDETLVVQGSGCVLQLTKTSFEMPVLQGCHNVFGHSRETLLDHMEAARPRSPVRC